MSNLNSQELQVVQAFATVELPEEIVRSANIPRLIEEILSSQDSSANAAQNLERLRQEKKDGNWFGNIWHGRNDKIQDAQIDLSTTIGRLTEKSSQLLIVNTALSKLLNDQQQVLMRQQLMLDQQANELKEQNLKILEQQKHLEHQQKEINAANQGLLEAKGLTQEQAQQLVGCVVRVTDAEKRLDHSNQELRNIVEQRHVEFEQDIQSIKVEMVEQNEALQHERENFDHRLKTQQQELLTVFDQNFKAISTQIIEIGIKQDRLQDENAMAIESLRDSVNLDMQHIANGLETQSVSLQNTDTRLEALHEEQIKNQNINRVALVVVALLALTSLAWQIAKQIA